MSSPLEAPRPAVRFLVLGPVSVARDGVAEPISSGRLRTLLASLLLYPNQFLPVTHLAERLWEESPPRDPRRVVQMNVARLRQVLGTASPVHTRPGGYLARLEPEQSDLLAFRELAAAASAVDDLEQEGRMLRQALRLWRGPACEDVESDTVRRLDVPGVAEARLRVLERRIKIDLLLGRGAELIAELRRLTAEHPLRERFWAQLMAALYRDGRQAEALDAFRSVSRSLADDLGIDPSAELRELHRRILTGDCAGHELLGGAGAPVTAPGIRPEQAVAEPGGDETVPHQAPVPAPRELPSSMVELVGRAAEWEALDGVLGSGPLTGAGPRLVVIDGPAGIGKTALATRWCETNAQHFPGGQVYLNLQGFDTLPPIETTRALHLLLRSVGVRAVDTPPDAAACSALFRSRTAARGLLVFLDNALSSDQVRPLLPGPGCLAVVTSRNQLRGLVARDAAHRISLSRLGPHQAEAVLASIVGEERVAAEPAHARRLAGMGDGSPLALRILGERLARLPDLLLADLADDLEHDQARLDAFSSADGELTDLRTVLSWSYHNLDDRTARVFRLVGGVYPGGDVGLDAAAALCDLPVAQARRHLDLLCANHLVEQYRPDRFHLHDLVRAYAAERVRAQDGADDRAAAALRLLTWFAHTLERADQVFAPHRLPYRPVDGPIPPRTFRDHRAALRWCETEYLLLTALPAWAHAHGAPQHAGRIAYLLQSFLAFYKRWHDVLDTHRVALAAVRTVADPQLEGYLRNAVGNAYAELRQAEKAQASYDRALAAFRRAGHRRGEAKILGNTGMLAIEQGDAETAERCCTAALEIYTELGDQRGRAHNYDNLGELQFAAGRHAEAIRHWRSALRINQNNQDRLVQITNLTNLGRAFAALNRHAEAITYYLSATAIARDTRNDRGAATALLYLGRSHRHLGDETAARESWQESFDILSGLADPQADEARQHLEAAS